MIYMRIDQIMIGQMIGDEAAGIYAAATRVSEVWYFIPMVIVATVFPTLMSSKMQSEGRYHARLQRLYDAMVWISILISAPISLLASPIIKVMYGNSYAEAGSVLAIHIWASVFVFLGTASGKWFMIENRLVMGLCRTLLGAGFNIALNLAFIPRFGPLGAAWATLVSYAIAGMLSDLMQSQTRMMFRMKLRAFDVVGCYQRNYKELKHFVQASK
jgi:PST family polysaccharide transporter